MKFRESIAARCRYGEFAMEVFGADSEIIWECSHDDYQGSANILLKTKDDPEEFVHYEWAYGSCSGCDDWEARNLTEAEIMKEMRRDANIFASRKEVRRYLQLENNEEVPEDPIPLSISMTSGSLSEMFRVISGWGGDEFQEMRIAFYAWDNGLDYIRQTKHSDW